MCPWSVHTTAAAAQGRYISATEAESTASTSYEDFSVPLASDELEEEALPPDGGEAQLNKKNSAFFGSSSCQEEKKANDYLVVNFYVLVDIDDPQLEVARHTSFMEKKDIHGRIYISSQGINAQYSGPQEDVMAYAEWVKEDPRFSSLYVQVSPSFGGHAFPRLKLRYKPSLVQVDGGTACLPITDPSSRAVPLSPKDWKGKLILAQNSNVLQASIGSEKEDTCKLMQRPLLLLDVRNGYEWDVGHFKGAQRPPVDCFKSTEFGLQYNEDPESDPLANVDKEHTDVLMYCTGGIRCDVYSAILRQKGFKNLYSLKGGIARYLIEENGENWLGNLFVFDSRLSVPSSAYKQSSNTSIASIEDKKGLKGGLLPAQLEFCRCNLCDSPLSSIRHRNCANLDCNQLFLCCDQCAHQVKGCCSVQCTSAPRQRPYFSSPQQYKRWHNYRGDDWLFLQPPDYVGKRAKRRQRRLEMEQQLQKTATHEIGGASGGLLQQIN